LTNFGEKKFQPFFGGDVISRLFENFSPFTSFEIKKAIERSIIRNEPRVDSLNVEVVTNIDSNSLQVTTRFTIRNSQEPVILSFNLERIR
jgi:phage baseplate assembly protein W